ncbi:MAG TPA: hypothetical protein DCP69_03180, partial [Candidatus Omnitrophica bacterium]|nr:hypothetical protein [Candidatus Omnitrophota bacterium]
MRWENALRRHLQGSGSLEGARDTIYSLLSRVAELDADVADVLFASWLGAQYQGPGGALFETIEQDPFELKPREAIQFFKKRELVSPEEFAAEEDAYKSRVFGLSRVSDRYVLDRVHGSLNKALEEGGTLDEFLTEVDGYAEKLGIGGRGDYYWETVFRNNMQTALNAGRYRQQMRAVDRRPYWQYNAVMDSKTRPAHRK